MRRIRESAALLSVRRLLRSFVDALSVRVLALEQLGLVQVRGVVPPEVLLDAPERNLHEAVVAVLPVRAHRLAECPLKFVNLCALKGPPCAAVRAVVVEDGVAETANRVHHRHRAIVHRVELVQTAWLVPGRHEKNVCAGGDAVRHLVAEADPRAHLVPVPALHVVEPVLQVLASAAEKDELDVLVHEEILRVEDEVDPFLLVEAPDEAEDDGVVLLGEAELALERRLARLLPCPQSLEVRIVVLVTVALEVRVVLGAPLRHKRIGLRKKHAHRRTQIYTRGGYLCEIDSVDDTGNLVGVVSDDRRQPPPALIGANLPRVPGRHSDDFRGVFDARLEDVHARPLQRIVEIKGACVVIRKPEPPHVVRVAPPLVRDVVDDEHGARIPKLVVILIKGAQVDWEERRMPIIGDVDEALVAERVSSARDVPHSLDGGLAQERSAPEHIHRAPAVNLFPDVAEARMVHKDDVHAVVKMMVVLHLHVFAAHVQGYTRPWLIALVVMEVHRNHAHHAMAAPDESLRERRHDIGEAASLAERRYLRSHHHNVHSIRVGANAERSCHFRNSPHSPPLRNGAARASNQGNTRLVLRCR
mmetsp:Transcript_22648/g.73632  ORF Transcript_22648/g.73632 Transcript_22648/m.73632 type:complete len:588 (+) Transcript_22648:108-1871(+)